VPFTLSVRSSHEGGIINSPHKQPLTGNDHLESWHSIRPILFFTIISRSLMSSDYSEVSLSAKHRFLILSKVHYGVLEEIIIRGLIRRKLKPLNLI
jgi:hypothetical protein